MTAPAVNTCPRRMTDFGPWDRTEGLDVPVDGRCPFCGSLTGDKFMERVRNGDQLGPTDKTYKVYLSDPWAKFYFQHLTETQTSEFFDLFQKQRLTIGYPGHFYVLPFFITIGPPEVTSDSTNG
jgi:hypothetical protein